jgi:uncharacterized caspase-like protein
MIRLMLVVALLVVCPAAGFAENYAVLAGVTRYALGERVPAVNLEGPENDLAALRQALLARGFPASHMSVLSNQRATHAGILAALRSAVEQARPGDLVLFYFSGHGTSAFDRHLAGVAAEIGPNSGALVPYDFDPSTRQTLVSTLLIGHRDLHPILSRLNPKARALVILDACYSQNSARGLEERGASRYLDLNALTREIPGSVAELERTAFAAPRSSGDELYPNVVSLAAASAHEAALDMTRRLLATGRVRSVDDLPHGAFTNSLLKGLRGPADTDHNGRITVEELFRYVREDVRRTFPHTPQLLPAADSALTASLSFTSGATPSARPQSTAPAGVLVRAENLSAELMDRLGRLAGVALSHDEYDLFVRGSAGGFDLFHGSRTFIHHFPASEGDALLRRVAWEHTLRELIEWHPSGQDFNLFFDVVEPRYQGSYHNGQHFKVMAGATAACHLLLLDINPDGSIAVLYPASTAETVPLPPNRRVQLFEAKAQAPYGTDYLKLLAFRDVPAGFQQWMCRPGPAGGPPQCPVFTPDSKAYAALWAMLHGNQAGRAQAVLPLVITE